MKKFLILWILMIVISQSLLCQRHTAKKLIPESILVLKKGIYMSMDEFLTNQPTITGNFEIVNNNPDYFIHPEERNKFFLSYYDIVGTKVRLSLEDVWGYYDGFGIFVSYKGKPYEILYLGSISLIRYEHRYRKNMAAQAISLAATGMTTTGGHSVQDMYFDLRNKTIVPRKNQEFINLIINDPEFYSLYKNDRKTKKAIKPTVYLFKYNEKYAIEISDDGIKLP